MLFVDTLLFAWQLILFIYRFWEVRIVNGQSPAFQQFNLIRDSRCLRKRIHCEGENAMNYIVACKWLFLDGLTPEIEAETRISLVQSNWNEVALNFLVDFFLFHWSPFVHNGWVYVDVTNSTSFKLVKCLGSKFWVLWAVSHTWPRSMRRNDGRFLMAI